MVKIQFQDTIISKRYIKIRSETNYSESHKRKRQKQSNGNQFYFSLILFDFFLSKKIETTESKHSIVKRTKNYHASDLSLSCLYCAHTYSHNRTISTIYWASYWSYAWNWNNFITQGIHLSLLLFFFHHHHHSFLVRFLNIGILIISTVLLVTAISIYTAK